MDPGDGCIGIKRKIPVLFFRIHVRIASLVRYLGPLIVRAGAGLFRAEVELPQTGFDVRAMFQGRVKEKK